MSRSPSVDYDVIVVGCGPAGTVAATELARAGASVLTLERERFPRYRIGESLTVSGGDLIRDFELVRDMERLDFPLKTGVKVIGQSARSEFYVPVARPTWQVRRDAFDELLLHKAIEQGATHRWGSVKRILRDGQRVTGVGFVPDDADEQNVVEVTARIVIDASGHSALLSTQGVAGPRTVDAFDRQIAMFTQFSGAIRDPGAMGNNTFIFYGSTHHWAWFIPLSSTLTSVGCVVPTSSYKEVGGEPSDVMAWALQHINPDLHRRVEGLEPTEPVRVVRNYSYRIDPFVGDGWLCVGDAHRFADPIFSYGVSFAMTGARAAASAALRAVESGSCTKPFADYAAYCTRGHDAGLDLIRYFWRFPAFFSFQTRGATRADMIKLLGGDCFGDEEIGVLTMMRRSLAEVAEPVPELVGAAG